MNIPQPYETISVIVTPEMAGQWKKSYHYMGQRQFKQWHCNNLVRMIKTGLFRKKTQIAFVRVDSRLYCTNGQHTLAAIELSGVPVELSIVVAEGKSMGDVADDFARHDTHLTRRFSDSLVAHSVHDELGVTPTALNTITAAILYYAYVKELIGTYGVLVTHDEKLSLVREYGLLGRDAWMIFEGAHNNTYLTRKTTLAACMICTSFDKDKSEQFFRAMALDDGLRQGDPRKTALEWLRQRTTPGGANARKIGAGSKVAADHELMKGIATAWNAWINGRELKLIKTNFDSSFAEFAHIGAFHVKGKRQIRDNQQERV